MAEPTPPHPVTSLVARRPRLTLALALLIGFGLSQYFQSRPPPWRELTLTPVVERVLTDAGSPRFGPEDADLTIVLFTDYQCPVCRRTDAALARFAANDGRVRVIYKDWPILGEGSTLGARAALAAHRQGKYVALHNGLMASRAKLDADVLRRVSDAAGIDWARLQADQAAHSALIDAQLARHATQAFTLGLEGTPTYLIGPYLVIGGLDEGQLARAAAAARKAGPPR